jgi:hypothetical protein
VRRVQVSSNPYRIAYHHFGLQEIEDMGFEAQPIVSPKADTTVLQIYGMT